MRFSPRHIGAIGTASVILCTALSGASASETDAALFMDAGGVPDLTPPSGWEAAARTERDGRRVLEYRFALPGQPGAKALVRVSLWKLGRSTKVVDLTPAELTAVEHGRDAAFAAREKEVNGLPGVHFESGGTQFSYTALEGSQRFHYVHYVGVTGVSDARSAMRPAVAIDLRCRNAVDEDSPEHAAAAEAVEAVCYELMLRL